MRITSKIQDYIEHGKTFTPEQSIFIDIIQSLEKQHNLDNEIIDSLTEENNCLNNVIQAQRDLIQHRKENMNQQPAPIDTIDLITLREAVDKYNEIDSENPLLAALPDEVIESFNHIVHAMNAILIKLDSGANLVNVVPDEV